MEGNGNKSELIQRIRVEFKRNLNYKTIRIREEKLSFVQFFSIFTMAATAGAIVADEEAEEIHHPSTLTEKVQYRLEIGRRYSTVEATDFKNTKDEQHGPLLSNEYINCCKGIVIGSEEYGILPEDLFMVGPDLIADYFTCFPELFEVPIDRETITTFQDVPTNIQQRIGLYMKFTNVQPRFYAFDVFPGMNTTPGRDKFTRLKRESIEVDPKTGAKRLKIVHQTVGNPRQSAAKINVQMLAEQKEELNVLNNRLRLTEQELEKQFQRFGLYEKEFNEKLLNCAQESFPPLNKSFCPINLAIDNTNITIGAAVRHGFKEENKRLIPGQLLLNPEGLLGFLLRDVPYSDVDGTIVPADMYDGDLRSRANRLHHGIVSGTRHFLDKVE